MGYTAENSPYKTPPKKNFEDVTVPKGGQKASYTPSANINPLSYGASGGKANAQSGSIPSVEANGSVVGKVPAMPGGNFSIGEDKNVSTPVSG